MAYLKTDNYSIESLLTLKADSCMKRSTLKEAIHENKNGLLFGFTVIGLSILLAIFM